MKLGKKLMVVAMAVATLSMVGCALNQDGEGAIRGKSIDFDNSYIFEKNDGSIQHAKDENDTTGIGDNKVTAKKNTSYYYRAVKQLATKHFGSTCIVSITPNNSGELESNGVMGYWIAGEENTDWDNESCNDMNCILIGVRYCNKDNCFETYISKYTNVAFKDNNFTSVKNLSDKDGNEASTTATSPKAKEVEILKGSEANKCSNTGAYFKLDGFNIDGEEYKVAIETIANEDGSYTINYYKVGDDGKQTGSAVKTLNISNTITGYNEPKQTNLGWYANIYPGQKLTGSWKFLDTKGNVIPVE